MPLEIILTATDSVGRAVHNVSNIPITHIIRTVKS